MRGLSIALALIAYGLQAQIPEPAPVPIPAPLPPAQSPPSAHFTMTAQGQFGYDSGTLYVPAPMNGSVNVALASSSTQGSAPITSYAWSVNGMPVACSLTCTATVEMAANSISLTVTDSNGQSSSASGGVNLSFHSGPTARFSISAQGRVGSSGQTLSLPASAGGGVSVSLSSTSQEGGAPITTYAWTANGAPISCAGAMCGYQAGTPTTIIGLTVTDSQGQSSSATASVQLVPGLAGAPPVLQPQRQGRPALSLVMNGGGKSSSEGLLIFDLPANGRVTVTMRAFNELGFPASGRFRWAVNGNSVCGDAYSCSYPFESPRNMVTVTVTGADGGSATVSGQINLRFQ
jgi:hypothetical protein